MKQAQNKLIIAQENGLWVLSGRVGEKHLYVSAESLADILISAANIIEGRRRRRRVRKEKT